VSPQCDHCGEHVSAAYYRVRKGNDGELHGCPSCTAAAIRERAAAGKDWDYQVRSCPDGEHVAADEGASS